MICLRCEGEMECTNDVVNENQRIDWFECECGAKAMLEIHPKTGRGIKLIFEHNYPEEFGVCKHMMKLEKELHDLSFKQVEKVKSVICGTLCDGSCKKYIG